MKCITRCMALLGLLLLILASTATVDVNPKFKVEIELSKETYIQNEPIWLDITLTNISSDTTRAGDYSHLARVRVHFQLS